MEYYSSTVTDEELEKLERKIKKEYGRAYVEMKAKADAYFEKLEDRYEKEYAAYQAGKYTEAEFKLWYKTQVQRGMGYRKMQNDLADRISRANEVAAAYINDKTPGIYSLNANYEAFRISQEYAGINFQLYNEQAVKRLIADNANHTEFRVLHTDRQRDYEWNSKKIQSALISGIMQGKPINKLADSFLSVMERNRSAAIRNARTAVTSAQNGGRQDTFSRAEDMGIKIEKQWISTLDERTRDSHVRLDGEVVGNKDTFSNGLEYPGDPSGPGEEVYNCRCTMISVLPDIKKSSGKEYKSWYNENIEPGTSIKSHKKDNIYDAVGIAKGAPQSIQIALKETNPLFSTQEEEYCENCQRAVQVYELRRRGYNVASQGVQQGYNELWGNELFVDKNGNMAQFEFGKTKEEIYNTLAITEGNARYIIYGIWKEACGAHDFIVELLDNKMYVIDPQSGNGNFSYAFDEMFDGKFGILRVDDKKITDDLNIIRDVCIL